MQNNKKESSNESSIVAGDVLNTVNVCAVVTVSEAFVLLWNVCMYGIWAFVGFSTCVQITNVTVEKLK